MDEIIFLMKISMLVKCFNVLTSVLCMYGCLAPAGALQLLRGMGTKEQTQDKQIVAHGVLQVSSLRASAEP